MALYAIADLHLSLAADKPMDVFGAGWHDYVNRIRENWCAVVGEDDTVLIPGDISWAMYLAEAEADLRFIDALPGQKIILKGNHDYWWETLKKLNEFVARLGLTTIRFLFNDCAETDEFIICGTRGWDSVGSCSEEVDVKAFARELGRLDMSLRAGAARNAVLRESGSGKKIICAMHYPPTATNFALHQRYPFIEKMKEYGACICLYGHIHGDGIATAPEGSTDGMLLKLISADSLEFRPYNVSERLGGTQDAYI